MQQLGGAVGESAARSSPMSEIQALHSFCEEGRIRPNQFSNSEAFKNKPAIFLKDVSGRAVNYLLDFFKLSASGNKFFFSSVVAARRSLAHHVKLRCCDFGEGESLLSRTLEIFSYGGSSTRIF